MQRPENPAPAPGSHPEGIDPEALAAIQPHSLDETIVSLRTYEPDGGCIEFSGRDLCQHTLVIGSTGSGKTTGVMYPLLRDLIAHQPDRPELQPGLLIYDSKEDDTLAMVEHFAAQAGRGDQVYVVGPDGTHALDFFQGGLSERTLNLLVEQLCSLALENNPMNEFWNHYRQTLLCAAITYWWLTSSEVSFESMVDSIQRTLLDESEAPNIQRKLSTIESAVEALPPSVRSLATTMIRTFRNWKVLDHRTKSNAVATVSNSIAPLTGFLANSFFLETPNRPLLSLDALNEGAIIVLRLPILRDPKLSRLIAGLVKGLCMQTGLNRPEQIQRDQRLVGLILDEYPLVVTGDHPVFGDVVQLQTLRSRGMFVVAATQGLVNLRLVIGGDCLNALLNNFGNLIFMHCPERETEAHARTLLGARSVPIPVIPDRSIQDAFVAEEPEMTQQLRIPIPIVQSGTLSQLNPHQALVRMHNGYRSNEALWLVPVFAPPDLQSSKLGNSDPLKSFREGRAISLRLFKRHDPSPDVPEEPEIDDETVFEWISENNSDAFDDLISPSEGSSAAACNDFEILDCDPFKPFSERDCNPRENIYPTPSNPLAKVEGDSSEDDEDYQF